MIVCATHDALYKQLGADQKFDAMINIVQQERKASIWYGLEVNAIHLTTLAKSIVDDRM